MQGLPCDAFHYVVEAALSEEEDSTPRTSLVNSSTGETLLDAADYLFVDRRRSYWAPAEALDSVSLAAHPTVWLPALPFASRASGVRALPVFQTENQAATHICAVVRGFFGRRLLRKMVQQRFSSVFSSEFGFLYFVDSMAGTSSWHKPLVARYDDIPRQHSTEESSEVAIQLSRSLFSQEDYLVGPFVKRLGAGQKSTARAAHSAFLIENPLRNIAILRSSDIDAYSTEIGSTVVWLDDVKIKRFVVDDYAIVRSAYAQDEGNNWAEVLKIMKKFPERVLLQCYCLRCFAKGSIPIEEPSQMISVVAKSALTEIENIVHNQNKQYRYTHVYFALEALFNFLSLRAGRAEFFSTVHIQAVGTQRETAKQNFYKFKLGSLHQYLQHIPVEEMIVPVVLEDDTNNNVQPTSRGCDVVALVFEVRRYETSILTSIFAVFGMLVSGHIFSGARWRVIDSIYLKCYSGAFSFLSLVVCLLHFNKTCSDDPTVYLSGLKLLYAICYR